MSLPENTDAMGCDQSSPPREWTLIVAAANNGVIGNKNGLPWKLSSDLRRFKQLSMGHCLLMGRKTFESIGRALPGRQTIVLSRSPSDEIAPGVRVVHDLDSVAQWVEPGRQVMVVGGAEVYRAALPACHQLWITRVLADVDGDTYLPPIDWSQWNLIGRTFTESSPSDQWPTEFQQWQRKKLRAP